MYMYIYAEIYFCSHVEKIDFQQLNLVPLSRSAFQTRYIYANVQDTLSYIGIRAYGENQPGQHSGEGRWSRA